MDQRQPRPRPAVMRIGKVTQVPSQGNKAALWLVLWLDLASNVVHVSGTVDQPLVASGPYANEAAAQQLTRAPKRNAPGVGDALCHQRLAVSDHRLHAFT